MSDTPLVKPIDISDDHYIAQLSMHIFSGPVATATAPVRSQTFAPGTNRIRTGVLATYVDMTAGHAPVVIGPTLDMRIQLLATPPTSGDVLMTSTPLRAGRQFVVSETWLRGSEAGSIPFVRATTTFMNNPVGTASDRPAPPVPEMAEASFDEFLCVRVRDANSVELNATERVANGVQGTVQGGAQALFAEVAAHKIIDPSNEMVVTDLEIRYLSKLNVGPLVANITKVPMTGGDVLARVTLTDGGAGDRLVSFVTLTMRPGTVLSDERSLIG